MRIFLTADSSSLATTGGPTVWLGFVTVLYLMSIVDLASSLLRTFRVGLKENAIFLCSTPDPIVPHLVVWHKGHLSIAKLGPRFYASPKSGSLVISTVRLEDEGNYTCSAKSGRRFEPYTATLIVSIPPKVRVTSTNPVTPHVGAKLTMSCTATGRPVPSIAWYSNKEVEIDEEYSEIGSRFTIKEQPGDTAVESYLVISPVFAEDHGSFACIATNHVGSSHDSTIVDVQRKPVMLSPVTDLLVYWWEGHKTNLTCLAVGNPAPAILWNSFEENGSHHQMPLTPVIQVNEGIVVSSSIWLPVEKTFDLPAIFDCQAENRYGVTTQRRFKVKVGYKPLAPIVYVLSIRDDELILSISIPWQKNMPPVEYITAHYHLTEAFREMESSITFKGNFTQFPLRGIMLYYSYIIKLKAVNIVGESEATVLRIYSEEKTFTLPPSAVSSDTTTETNTDKKNGDNVKKESVTNDKDKTSQPATEADDTVRTLQSKEGNNSSKLSPQKLIIAVIVLTYSATNYLLL